MQPRLGFCHGVLGRHQYTPALARAPGRAITTHRGSVAEGVAVVPAGVRDDVMSRSSNGSSGLLWYTCRYTMPPAVFISYASADEDQARVIRDDLESDGIECWMGSRDIRASEDYVTTIPPVIAAAKLLLVVISGSALVSPHVFGEVHLATDDKKPILPVRIEPIAAIEGKLKFPLAGRQWVDATPRLAPALPTIRAEVRRLLTAEGLNIKPVRPTSFQRTLASAFAWAVVAWFTALVTLAMQAHWMNLVPWFGVPRAAAGRVAPLLLLVTPLVLALGTQYYLHRRLQAVLSLDAVFAISPRAALVRTLVALAGTGVLVWAIVQSPPTIQINRRAGPSSAPPGDGLVAVRGCSTTLYEQSATQYVVALRVGRFNPPGQYTLRVELRYTDPDSVNFCEVWASERLGIRPGEDAVDPQWDDTLRPIRVRFIKIERPEGAFVGSTHVRFTLIHPRRSPPMQAVGVSAVIESVGYAMRSETSAITSEDWK